MSIVFPVVPLGALGLPPLSRNEAIIVAATTLMTNDVFTTLSSIPVKWGIFLNGLLALNATSVIAIEPRKEWHIPDYPIEKGNFESYNKVRMPLDVRVRLTKGGTEAQRSQFLVTLDQIAASLDLYDVVTPEFVYTNVNIVRYDYQRTSQHGLTLLTVDLIFQEIRSKALTTFTNTKTNTAQPAGAPQSNAGVVQPKTVPGIGTATPPITMDNLPGFSQPGVNYSALGFQ